MPFKPVYNIIKPFEKTVRIFLFVAPQENGAKRRAERQSVKGREDNRRSNRNGKLLIYLSGNTGHQPHGNKNRKQDESCGNDCAGNLLHGFNRSVMSVHFLIDHQILHPLNHDNRIVHHQADSQNHGKQR